MVGRVAISAAGSDSSGTCGYDACAVPPAFPEASGVTLARSCPIRDGSNPILQSYIGLIVAALMGI